MNMKTNEILNDVIHTASQAILCDDEAIKRQAVGDIIDALANVVPTERAAAREAAARSGVRALPEQPGLEYLTVAPGVKLKKFKGTNAVRLVAVRKGAEGNADNLFEISVDRDNATARIECDGELMYQIRTLGLSDLRLTKAAVNVLRCHLCENMRVTRNHRIARQYRAAEKREGILTEEEELEETIRRQLDEENESLMENS